MGLSHERDRLLSCPVGVEATAPNKDHPGGQYKGKGEEEMEIKVV